jgi:hypothetical protein
MNWINLVRDMTCGRLLLNGKETSHSAKCEEFTEYTERGGKKPQV